ncbi:DUF2939 domain-containing protein [Lysobacter sp. 5GHs7-4]|uniref:DUF2939 domain-containing protein n=1 Tax=Lysobacter sp. 5GHs7-4 TaxID=2904253 RepID=UPI001E5D814E|nr:DUF2939 domain-containing protein [Lysobacter sp. 5GHs7-4]UHQ21328.1 DUF2939 domain-containing protein [Lysobacter sp. 5GHs7-4]
MKKWIALLVLALALLLGYVAAGPYLTVNAIRKAVQEQDTAALNKHVDFPALRLSLKAQVQDYLVREAGVEMQANPFGALALRLAGGLAGGAVDALATPVGIGAVLEGRNFYNRLGGGGRGQDVYAPNVPADPLKDAKYGYESPSRFTATVANADGEPVVFVLTRSGLSWKLSDIRLPLGQPQTAAP